MQAKSWQRSINNNTYWLLNGIKGWCDIETISFEDRFFRCWAQTIIEMSPMQCLTCLVCKTCVVIRAPTSQRLPSHLSFCQLVLESSIVNLFTGHGPLHMLARRFPTKFAHATSLWKCRRCSCISGVEIGLRPWMSCSSSWSWLWVLGMHGWHMMWPIKATSRSSWKSLLTHGHVFSSWRTQSLQLKCSESTKPLVVQMPSISITVSSQCSGDKLLQPIVCVCLSIAYIHAYFLRIYWHICKRYTSYVTCVYIRIRSACIYVAYTYSDCTNIQSINVTTRRLLIHQLCRSCMTYEMCMHTDNTFVYLYTYNMHI